MSAGLLILLSLFAISTVNAVAISPEKNVLSDVQPAIRKTECVYCTLALPRCKDCPAGYTCKIAPQTCKRCSYAYCEKLTPSKPIKPYLPVES
jgi:hypothetical protein